MFYQILEGEPDALYDCLNRIQRDQRHQDLFVIKREKQIPNRLYGDWNMKTIVLDDNEDPVIAPLKNLLDLVTRTYRTLEHYAPVEVLEGLQQGLDPLEWTLKRQKKAVLFADIVGFSTMVEKMNLKELQKLLNTFFDISLNNINQTGGRISKLLGDGFMAYYPIDKCKEALYAATSIIFDLKSLRASTRSSCFKLVHCGIGISAGTVVEGNIGSQLKKDFTLLGDVVNSAARLQNHTRQVGYPILFDHRFKSSLSGSLDWPIKDLGVYRPKGKINDLTIYSLEHPDLVFSISPDQISYELKNL
jgi:class 3 adenylate cyclase